MVSSLQLSATVLFFCSNDTIIQGWGCLYLFSLLLSKLSNLWIQIYLLSLITYKCLYILQMRATLKIYLQHLRYKCKYASPAITLISASLIFQKHFKMCKMCVALLQLSSTFMLAWLTAYDAPASYSFAWNFSWTPIDKLLHGMSMLMDFGFIFPTDIFN